MIFEFWNWLAKHVSTKKPQNRICGCADQNDDSVNSIKSC